MESEYRKNPSDFQLFSWDEYLSFFVRFLEKLNPGIVVERFTGEAPLRFHTREVWDKKRSDQFADLIEKRLEDGDVITRQERTDTACKGFMARTLRSPFVEGGRVEEQVDGGVAAPGSRLTVPIDRDERRVGPLGRDDEHVAGPRQRLDAYLAEDLALRQSHVDVPWAHDLVHPRDGLRPERQRGNCLRAPYTEHPVDPRLPCRREHERDQAAVGLGRHNHHDLVDAGHPGGGGAHVDSAR